MNDAVTPVVALGRSLARGGHRTPATVAPSSRRSSWPVSRRATKPPIRDLHRAVRRARWSSAPPGCAAFIGAGPQRMNRVLVRKVSAGLAAYLIENVPDAKTRGVAISHDARRNSRVFAEDTARVSSAACRHQESTSRIGRMANADGTAWVGDRQEGVRGRDGHSEPQSARVQRLQGLLGQRSPDHSAARHRHRSRYRPRSAAAIELRDARARCSSARSGHRRSTSTKQLHDQLPRRRHRIARSSPSVRRQAAS